jgi:hypothetical protein
MELKNQVSVPLLDKSKEACPTKMLSVPDKNPALTNAIILNPPAVILKVRQQELFASIHIQN